MRGSSPLGLEISPDFKSDLGILFFGPNLLLDQLRTRFIPKRGGTRVKGMLPGRVLYRLFVIFAIFRGIALGTMGFSVCFLNRTKQKIF